MILRSKLYPVTHLLNPKFNYVPASQTDIRKTFERIKKGEREMQEEIIIYALPKGTNLRYQEGIISTQCRNQSDIDKVIAAASKDGWHSFRIWRFNWDKPDFAGAIAK